MILSQPFIHIAVILLKTIKEAFAEFRNRFKKDDFNDPNDYGC